MRHALAGEATRGIAGMGRMEEGIGGFSKKSSYILIILPIPAISFSSTY
jgi:hypothetical protein